MGGGVEGAYRRTESVNPASIPLQGMGQRLVAIGALLVEAVFEQMSPLIHHTQSRAAILSTDISSPDACKHGL